MKRLKKEAKLMDEDIAMDLFNQIADADDILYKVIKKINEKIDGNNMFGSEETDEFKQLKKVVYKLTDIRPSLKISAETMLKLT